ncbi:MAG: hypothetical protein NC318_08545 [Blautia sp.]|nr:hypothetical protein [Lachnoclostridium sp.]MCM1211638.1 hypothetical protein [Blautia sp.]
MGLKSVMIEDKEGKYVFCIFPMLQKDDELILSKDRSGKTVIASGSEDQELTVDKSTLEKLSYAYVFVKNGEKYDTPVRVLTRPPRVHKILLQSEGQVKIVQKELNQYTRPAGLLLKFVQGQEEMGEVSLGSGVFAFDLAQAGIAFEEKIAVEVQMRFRLVDENQTAIFGPVISMVMVISPPAIEQIVREEKGIELKLAEEPVLPLYARIYRDGQEIYGALQCVRKDDVDIRYMIFTDTLNLKEGCYALSVACMNEQMASYWSAPFPVLTRYPVIRSARLEAQGWAIQMQEKGYYCWQGQYGWTDQIQTTDERKPEIRYADRCGSVVSLGPAARITESIQDYFVGKDGFYCREKQTGNRTMSEKYVEYDNMSFRITEKNGIWSLSIKEGCHETVAQDFRELLVRECTSYAQLEELSESFGDIALRPEDMLAVRYGYRPDQGACDIRAGMSLCFDYEQYQNIPEDDRWTVSGEGSETVSDHNLSGFTGSGSSMFHSILRDGAVTFEPFAQEMVQSGRLTVEPPQVEQDGRIAMGAGIWDTLFAQFHAPFVKLLYPAQWKQSGHLNHGSMYYYDNVCLAAADSYDKLEEALRRFQNQSKPSGEAAYVCFRGRTAVKLMIHIFVEGHPQMCALGTTLGDIVTAYGLGRNVLLERLYEERYIPFMDTNEKLPLYIGDRICSR